MLFPYKACGKLETYHRIASFSTVSFFILFFHKSQFCECMTNSSQPVLPTELWILGLK